MHAPLVRLLTEVADLQHELLRQFKKGRRVYARQYSSAPSPPRRITFAPLEHRADFRSGSSPGRSGRRGWQPPSPPSSSSCSRSLSVHRLRQRQPRRYHAPVVNILLVGGGGREHAIAWKLRQSPRVTDLFVAPGNAGTPLAPNLPLKAGDLEGIVRAARQHHIDLVVVGPEDPLARGLVDRLAVEGIAAFGPPRHAAHRVQQGVFQGLMLRYGIPTARGASSPRTDARNYVERWPRPVVKAGGLAPGKGAFVPEPRRRRSRYRLDDGGGRRSGTPAAPWSSRSGWWAARCRLRLHRWPDVVPMPFACDYKRALDGDEGPNTGGMGAYSPPGWLDEETAGRIDRE